MLFKKKNDFVEEDVTPAEASQIYDLMKDLSKADIRKFHGFRMHKILQVRDEMKRIEREVFSKMSGGFVVTPMIPAVFDDEGNIVQEEVPAEYFNVTTKTALVSSISSDILDVAKVVDDVILWSDGNPDKTKTWTEFKNSFNVG